jgi:hypothetical protein
MDQPGDRLAVAPGDLAEGLGRLETDVAIAEAFDEGGDGRSSLLVLAESQRPHGQDPGPALGDV